MNKKFFIIGVPSLVGGAVTWSLYLLPSNDNKFLESSILENTYSPINLTNSKIGNFKSSGKGFLNHVIDYGKSYRDNKFLYGGDVSEEVGGKRIGIIEDHTLRLGTACGAYGTGWFLDYEIPENNKQYPTKWFIATNAHVINSYRFKENKYNQKLPLPSYSRKQCTIKGENYTSVYLSKEVKVKQDNKEIFDKSRSPEEWLNLSNSVARDFYSINAKDANLYHADISSDESIFYYLKISDPKLFYVSINFLGEKKWASGEEKNYYKDFAVLEVDFPNERAAKLITDDFYNKIKDKKTEELNFFAEDLLENKTSDELESDNESYFLAGYPSNSNNQFRIAGNYRYTQKRASKVSFVPYHLDYASVRNIYDEKIVGHMDAIVSIDWGVTGGKLYGIGYDYLIDNIPHWKGASGSLVTNSKGEVLGLYSWNLDGEGGVTPIRTKGFYDGTKWVYPAYDLILGAEGQTQSYKSQLDAHYPNLKTYLRNKWTELSKK